MVLNNSKIFDIREAAQGAPKKVRNESAVAHNKYTQLLSNPIATLVRTTDERPDVADVAVLGYD